DSPFQEIHTLRFDDTGRLYVAALSGRPSSGGGATTVDTSSSDQPSSSGRALTPSVSVSTEITAIVVDSGAASTSTARTDRGTAKGAIYRITPDGVWDQLWDSKDDVPY